MVMTNNPAISVYISSLVVLNVNVNTFIPTATSIDAAVIATIYPIVMARKFLSFNAPKKLENIFFVAFRFIGPLGSFSAIALRRGTWLKVEMNITMLHTIHIALVT